MENSDDLDDELRLVLSEKVAQMRQAARLKVLEGMVIHILSSSSRSQPEETTRADYEKNVEAMEDLMLRIVSDRDPNAATFLSKLLEEARKEEM